MNGKPPTICIAENRSSCEPALRILVASLTRHCPGLRVMLFCPDASDGFRRWLAAFPDCSLNPVPLDGVWTKYDIKPLALLSVLKAGADEVIWIDSDILIARDFRPLFAALPAETLAVAEEALSGSHADPAGLRARLWGMPVGRTLPFAVNTGVVRVTVHHHDLLLAWHEMMQGHAYRAAQAAPWTERPAHLAGDQEVMTALLASTRFAAVPLRLLRRGRDIIQFFGSAGYTLSERLRHLRTGLPPFVHSQGFHPWWPQSVTPAGGVARFHAEYASLSPYIVLARDYATSLENDAWLRPQTPVARLLSLGSAPLTGLPMAAIADGLRAAKALAAVARRRRRSVPRNVDGDA